MALHDVIARAMRTGARTDAEPAEDEDKPEVEPAPADDAAEEEDGDESAEEEDPAPAASEQAQARAAERERIRAILSTPHAARHPKLATHLALETDVDPKAASDMLKAAGAGPGLATRMGADGNPNLGDDAGARRASAADGWNDVVAKVNRDAGFAGK